MFSLPFIFSIFPFAFFLLLLFGKKTSLLVAATATLVLVAGLTISFWRIFPIQILLSLTKGFLVALDIFVIILGAIFFLEILKKIGVIDNIRCYLESFSKDYRVQVILLAWFLENFLEGTAGFGTPSAVVAPLLVGLGLSPMAAVIIALLGNSTAGVFGAAGTPIRVGFAGLDTATVPAYAASINIVGFLVPAFMLWTLVAGQKDRKDQFLEALPFALWSGMAFVVPSVLTVALGQEFPSIIGAVIGLMLVLLTNRLGLFLPKNPRSLRQVEKPRETLPLLKTLFPYALLIILLVLGKFLLGSKSLLTLPAVKHSISLFNPGLAFVLAGLPVAIFWGRQRLVFASAKIALKRSVEPFLVIVSMSTMVQLMINSGQNLSGFPSSLEFMAKSFENFLLPFLAPLVGAFGSFITGSVTVSNIMFGSLLTKASSVLSLNASKILALGLVGAAAGNMIALADILAAETVVGLHNGERQVLKGVIVPCAIYVILVGLVGVLITS